MNNFSIEQDNLEFGLIEDQDSIASQWRCIGCGRTRSYFDKSWDNCDCVGLEFTGTWCPIKCLMVSSEVEV